MTRALAKQDLRGKTDPTAFDGLAREVQALSHQPSNSLIGFIAAKSGEGVTTVSSMYAKSMAGLHGHTVLKITLAERETGSSKTTRPTLVECVLTDIPLDDALEEGDHPLIQEAVLASAGDSQRNIVQCLSDDQFWSDLRSQFDTIIFDLPALSRTRLPLVIAPYLDGVILVVQAEATREPVVKNLIKGLNRAKVLGCVMNKRQYHIPKMLYRMFFG